MSGNSRGTAFDTRRKLLASFNSLVLSGKDGKITVADIVSEAGVGRTTFYDHYSSVDDIHQQALSGPMSLLADCVLGVQSSESLAHLLSHFWENRERARNTLAGEEGEKVERLLVSIFESRLGNSVHRNNGTKKVTAIELAVVPLALIRAWLSGAVHGTADDMARHVADASERMRKALL